MTHMISVYASSIDGEKEYLKPTTPTKLGMDFTTVNAVLKAFTLGKYLPNSSAEIWFKNRELYIY